MKNPRIYRCPSIRAVTVWETLRKEKRTLDQPEGNKTPMKKRG